MMRLRLTIVLLLAFTALGLRATSPAHAATLDVCPSGCNYSQIVAALAAASNGDTIHKGLTKGQPYDLLVQAGSDPFSHAIPFTD